MKSYYCTALKNDCEILTAYETLEEAQQDMRRSILESCCNHDEKLAYLQEAESCECWLDETHYYLGVVEIRADEIDDCYAAELNGIDALYTVIYNADADIYTTT